MPTDSEKFAYRQTALNAFFESNYKPRQYTSTPSKPSSKPWAQPKMSKQSSKSGRSATTKPPSARLESLPCFVELQRQDAASDAPTRPQAVPATKQPPKRVDCQL
uniref:Uncharacterized protein n=1 Tax=Panagrellus redivivus TaxID=6233 RepID=A0A7E4VSN3_PANRE